MKIPVPTIIIPAKSMLAPTISKILLVFSERSSGMKQIANVIKFIDTSIINSILIVSYNVHNDFLFTLHSPL